MLEVIKLSKAMADENRLHITALIAREKEACVCEISDTLKLSQPLVSRHLKQLKEAGVLESRKEGKWILYAIAANPIPLLQSYLRTLVELGSSLPTITSCIKR